MFIRTLKPNVVFSALTLAVVLVLTLNGGNVWAQRPTQIAPLLASDGDEVVPNQYIVVYKRDVVTANAESAIRTTVAAQGGQVKFVYQAALNGYSAYLPAKALAAVRADSAVAYVEADRVIRLDPYPVSTDAVQSGAPWGLDRIDQRNLPLSNAYTYKDTGANVHVYVIDTGIRPTHSEFGGRASRDYDSVGDGGMGNDCNGHGTHVAGIIGGSTYGVAKNVRIHGVRVLDCGGWGTYSRIIAGINWVAANHTRPAVVNMSLGGKISTAADAAINNLINSGVPVVVSAGNSDEDACNYTPAHVSNAITVGASMASDARSSFSNWGTCLDIFAPGSAIISASNSSDSATRTISGTSMAAPHVAGMAALYMQSHPAASPVSVRNAIVKASSANVISSPGTGSPNRLLYSLFGLHLHSSLVWGNTYKGSVNSLNSDKWPFSLTSQQAFTLSVTRTSGNAVLSVKIFKGNGQLMASTQGGPNLSISGSYAAANYYALVEAVSGSGVYNISIVQQPTSTATPTRTPTTTLTMTPTVTSTSTATPTP
jgi:subtilisin family serine protease